MMPRRPDGTKRIVEFTRHHHTKGFDDAAHRQQCRLISVDAHLVILMVQGAMAGKTHLLKPPNIPLGVDRFHPLDLGTLGGNPLQVGQKAGCLDALIDLLQALGHLGVVRTGIM